MDKIVGEFQIHQKEAANGASELKPHGTEPPVAVANGEEKEADESDFTTGEEEHKVPAEPHGTDLSSNETTAEQEGPEPSGTGRSFTSKGSQSLDLEHARVLDCELLGHDCCIFQAITRVACRSERVRGIGATSNCYSGSNSADVFTSVWFRFSYSNFSSNDAFNRKRKYFIPTKTPTLKLMPCFKVRISFEFHCGSTISECIYVLF